MYILLAICIYDRIKMKLQQQQQQQQQLEGNTAIQSGAAEISKSNGGEGFRPDVPSQESKYFFHH